MRASEAFGIVFVCGLFAGASWYCVEPVHDRFNTRVTVYNFTCLEWSIAGAPCLAGWKRAPITTYTVDLPGQFVVEQTEGSPIGPDRHDSCVIADRENWTCTLPGDASNPLKLRMRDGAIQYDERLRAIGANLRQIPRWRWLLAGSGG
jgi:hypothetical protein